MTISPDGSITTIMNGFILSQPQSPQFGSIHLLWIGFGHDQIFFPWTYINSLEEDVFLMSWFL